MALTIMPRERELKVIETTMAWTDEENHQESPWKLKNLIVPNVYCGEV